VCLFDSPASIAAGKCLKSRQTNGRGTFVIAGLGKGTYFISAPRPIAAAPGAAWLPELRKVVIARNGSVVRSVDFTLVTQGDGAGFRNFRNDLTLTAAAFPELAGFVAAGRTAALKVFIPSKGGEEAEILYLGEIADPETLVFNLSVPRGATTLGYQIFAPGQAVAGEIALPNEQ
jgi:hypothetical protein